MFVLMRKTSRGTRAVRSSREEIDRMLDSGTARKLRSYPGVYEEIPGVSESEETEEKATEEATAQKNQTYNTREMRASRRSRNRRGYIKPTTQDDPDFLE